VGFGLPSVIISHATVNKTLSRDRKVVDNSLIYHEGKRLPQDKHDLYERIVDNVLHNRYRNDMSELEMAREHLSVVAYGMHT
jgi:hypothetical protein